LPEIKIAVDAMGSDQAPAVEVEAPFRPLLNTELPLFSSDKKIVSASIFKGTASATCRLK